MEYYNSNKLSEKKRNENITEQNEMLSNQTRSKCNYNLVS